ncbi:MAG: PKD domain-containing protein [Gemmatimonadaceae bacterium]
MRATTALTFVLFAACRGDTLTDPGAARIAPTQPDLALTGGVGTPIFPTAPLGEPQAKGVAIGLNASGQVTGGAIGIGGVDGNKPYRWTPGVGYVTLSTCCENGAGSDINAAGAVVGSNAGGPNAAYRGFLATGNTFLRLPILPNVPFDNQEENSEATALNDAVEIVGFSPSTTAFSRHAVRWTSSGEITDLGTLGGTSSRAVDINNAGQIIGMSQIAGNADTHAFIWTSGTGMQDLSTLIGATITDVVEINDAGQIIGTYTAPSGQTHAFRYTPGAGLLDLGTLGGTSSAPTGLNGRGEVVGSSTLADGSTHAFLWTPADGMEDITARSGVPEVRRLNDNLQTLTVTAPPGAVPGVSASTSIPRLVQLQVTQSNAPPTAIFTWTCNSLTCTLDASGSLDDKPGLTYAWDLNKYPDGSATGAVVTVTYPHESQRTVTLTVTDAQGLTSSSSQTIPVREYPVAAFTATCTELTCSFDSSGSTNNGNPIGTRNWYFGDGKTAYNVAAPSHTYAQAGTYAVRMEILYNSPAPATVIQQVTVTAPAQNQPPVASFNHSCTGTVCTLDATGSTDDKGIVSYAWNLGKAPDGTASGPTVTTDYWHTSTRTVTLTVMDAEGLSNSITQTFDVGTSEETTDAPPAARFTYSCSGTVCTLDASTSTDDVGITSYAWSLGKAPDSTATGVTVTTDYWHTSTRPVTLTVTDTKGQTNSVTQTVMVP